jgi:hypothetical protein
MLNVVTEHGTVMVIVRDSRTASRIGEYMNAVKQRARGGESTPLAAFRGARSARMERRTGSSLIQTCLIALDEADALPESPYSAIQGMDR